MKKYFSIIVAVLLAAMALSLASCSKDDDDDDDAPSGNSSIVGSWRMVEGVADAIDCEQYVQFREDGTYFDVVVYGDSWNGLLGTEVQEGTWSLDGKNLKIKISTKTTKITVKKVTSKELILEEFGLEIKLIRVSDAKVNKILEDEGY